MSITIEYVAQLKRLAGHSSESIESPEEFSLSTLIQTLGKKHGSPLSDVLITSENEVAPTLLIFLNDEQINTSENPAIRSGDTLTISTPISGG